jgi:hypothetical protein
MVTVYCGCLVTIYYAETEYSNEIMTYQGFETREPFLPSSIN